LVIDRLVRRREALLLHFLMNFTGVMFSFLVNLKVGAITFFVSFLLWLYSNDLKRRALIGNLLIAFLTALSLIIVAIYFDNGYLLVYCYALFSFLISIAREVVKDMEDVQGDESHGCKTLPILKGVLFAKKFVYVVFISLFISMVLISKVMNSLAMLVTTSLVLVLLAFISYKLYYADKKKDFRILGNLCKLVMLLGVFSMVLA
ncbi:MAG: geranylgeranylglycerol-phosphate geranylgeranyltransferase, partial [Cytophagales bacterium]